MSTANRITAHQTGIAITLGLTAATIIAALITPYAATLALAAVTMLAAAALLPMQARLLAQAHRQHAQETAHSTEQDRG